MAHQTRFAEFLSEFEFKTNRPASENQLAKAESTLGFSLPDLLRRCYLTCNGGVAQNDRSALQLFSLNQAIDYGGVPGFLDSFWGYFPFAENNDSNPVCICCKSPLAGYIVLVSHGDSPRLMYRSLDGFFRAAIEHLRSSEFFDTYTLESEFSTTERTKKDLAIARQLIELAADEVALGEYERTDARRFACDLLSDEDVEAFAALLEVDDEYVREHVMQRLQQIPGAKAKKVLKQFADSYDGFVERCAKRLQSAGIEAAVVESHGKKTIRIDPGPIWLNMEMFYSERRRPDIEDMVLERARFFIADEEKQRKKRGRRG